MRMFFWTTKPRIVPRFNEDSDLLLHAYTLKRDYRGVLISNLDASHGAQKKDGKDCYVPVLIRPPLCNHYVELFRLCGLQEQSHYYARVTMNQNRATILHENGSECSLFSFETIDETIVFVYCLLQAMINELKARNSWYRWNKNVQSSESYWPARSCALFLLFCLLSSDSFLRTFLLYEVALLYMQGIPKRKILRSRCV